MLSLAAVGGPTSLQLNFPVHVAKLRTRHAVSARMPSEQRQDDRGRQIYAEANWREEDSM